VPVALDHDTDSGLLRHIRELRERGFVETARKLEHQAGIFMLMGYTLDELVYVIRRHGVVNSSHEICPKSMFK